MMKITKILSIILLAVAFVGSEAEAKVAAKHDFVVVIDAGHGGKDIGATDNNVKEKDINLGVAKKLAARIRKELKGVKVVMTRGLNRPVSGCFGLLQCRLCSLSSILSAIRIRQCSWVLKRVRINFREPSSRL